MKNFKMKIIAMNGSLILAGQIANAKAVFAGPHRGISRKHLQSYLSEVCYRFNRRFWEREAFHRLLYAGASTTTVTRDELMRS